MQERLTMRGCLASILIVMILAEGCATTGPLVGPGANPTQAAVICGAGGAAVGAASGAALGARSGGRGALVGALVGAVVGAIVAATACFAISYKSEPVKSYQETQKDVAYRPDQGTVIQITDFRIAPAAAAPGTKVTFQASYYVMAPEADQEVALVETRIVTAVNPKTGQRSELGRHTGQVTVKPGTRRGDGEFEVKAGVSEGQYEIAFQVEGGGKQDGKMLTLDVTKNPVALRDPARQTAMVTATPGGKSEETPVSTTGATGLPAPPSAPVPSPAAVVTPAEPGAQPPLATLGESNPAPPPTATVAAVTRSQSASQKVLNERYFVASRVTGKGNLREGPGTTYKVVGEIAKGERFVLLETSTPGGTTIPWHKIRLEDGREAWVSSALGEEVKE